MEIQELNSGIIYTNSNCIGCNKCISCCVAVGANVVIKNDESGLYSVLVDPNKCILCGACIETCVHQARTYRDDTADFFEALERGEKISILVSPTLITDYKEKYHNILGYLKHLGVNHIYNTGFGGDLMVWVYINFIRQFGVKGVISQFCPVIANYMEKYRPELLGYLMPVQSPVMCTAIYISEYLHIEDKLAYITPCIATKYEIDDVNTYHKVAYNVTFERLMERLDQCNIFDFYAEDEVDYGLGALIPTSGGLSDNIERYAGFDEVLIQTAGPEHIFPYFEHYYKEVTSGAQLPFLVDALSCTNGCNFGTGTCRGIELRNKMTFSAHDLKEHAYRSGIESSAANPEERFKILNQKFSKYDLSSFVRQYGQTRRISLEVLSDQDISDIFDTMYKEDECSRHTDCGSCGYKSCYDMAYAVGTNVNHKENCINYSKECIRRETEKTEQLLNEISKMNEELKRSTQLKSNFLANMSHEIRTPMNAIIGMAEMAMRGDLGEEERTYIHQIRASGRSLLAIINDILDFSKIESGKMELNEAEYQVMSIINDTVNIVMTRIGEKDITLIIDAEPEMPYLLYGDDIRIKQILVNLANNAVKFTRSGCVEIVLHQEYRESELYLTVDVRDTGIGIKPEDLEKLFTSFQQVDSKRNRNEEGTGLGLAISREFVRIMNGEINIESTYGEGSTFSFKIPQKIVDDRPSVVITRKTPVKTASMIKNSYIREGFLKAVKQLHLENTECVSLEQLEQAVNSGVKFAFIGYPYWDSGMDEFTQKHLGSLQVAVIVDPRKHVITKPYVKKLNQPIYSLNIASVINNESLARFEQDTTGEQLRFEAPDANILIVDDNTINLTVAKGLLSPMHMNIHTACSAMEAISLLERNQYDIVFMDHMMPDIDGIDATHMIREKGGAFESLPIIALTANAINNAEEMFLREGMNDFVAKPIEMIDITAKLRRWLPDDKIKPLLPEEKTQSQEAQSQETKKVLEIEGLDVTSAMALSGTQALYLEILADFYETIEKKAALITKYEAEENLEAYTIEVHALKSAAKLIGAAELSRMAAELEKCGQEGDWQFIHGKTEALVKRYREYIPILAPYGRTAIIEENHLTSVQLKEQLLALIESLDDFDIDSAKTIMDELRACHVSEQEQAVRQTLCDLVNDMEYDDAADAAKEWIEHIKENNNGQLPKKSITEVV